MKLKVNSLKSKLKIATMVITFFSGSLLMNAQQIDAKSQMLLKALKKVNGGWSKLSSKKDVEYTYIYDDKQKGVDISKERYIFDGEHSWASYSQHEVNVLPAVKGLAKQSLVSDKSTITLDDTPITDKMAVGGTTFLRKANFFWFTMMYKLDNPGTIFKYIGKEVLNDSKYDKVMLSYDAKATGKEQNDTFILYFNTKTHLIDQFYFSLPAFGVNEPVLRMELEYEQVDDIYLSTERKAYMPDEKGVYLLGGIYTSKDIKFNNGFTIADFKL